VLSGTVDTDAARPAAENAAKQADGVKGVVNNLQLVTIASAAKAAEVVSERRTPNPKPIVAKAAKAPKAAVPEKTAEPAAPTNRWFPVCSRALNRDHGYGSPVHVRYITPSPPIAGAIIESLPKNQGDNHARERTDGSD
jgi:hypothetical protein